MTNDTTTTTAAVIVTEPDWARWTLPQEDEQRLATLLEQTGGDFPSALLRFEQQFGYRPRYYLRPIAGTAERLAEAAEALYGEAVGAIGLDGGLVEAASAFAEALAAAGDSFERRIEFALRDWGQQALCAAAWSRQRAEEYLSRGGEVSESWREFIVSNLRFGVAAVKAAAALSPDGDSGFDGLLYAAQNFLRREARREEARHTSPAGRQSEAADVEATRQLLSVRALLG